MSKSGVLHIPQIKPTILVVDDELSIRRSLSILLKRIGTVITASSAEDALKMLETNQFDLALLDIRLPDISGLELLKRIKKKDEFFMAIMITAVQDTKTAVEAMKLGAYDYITKPFDVKELRALVGKALEKRSLIRENSFLHSEIERLKESDDLVMESPAMKNINKLVDKAASSNGSVLILGESGTGKELIANAIHDRGGRRNGPFIAINCAGIPDNLLESELFGHEAGSFTGAAERREGKFEKANGGTIFLDEIGNMSFNLQAKVLRVLQEKKDGTREVERVGSSKPISLDVRIISATNKDLNKAMEEGKFREDLYYRLNVFPIIVPPLCERTDDIPLLADYFLNKFNRKLDKGITGIDGAAMRSLLSYPWPGNVRELKNIIERIVSLKQEGPITIEDLPVEILMDQSLAPSKKMNSSLSLTAARDQLEKQMIRKALRKADGNQKRAAMILGIHRNTLFSRMNELGLKKGILFDHDEAQPPETDF